MILHILYLSCLLFCFLMALSHRKWLKSRQLLVFIPYIFLVLVQEFSLTLYTIQNPLASTGIVYNIYKPISVLTLSLFYYYIPFNIGVRKLILWLLSIYLTITVITFVLIQPVTIYNSYLSLAGGFVITTCGIFFLFNYFNLDNRTQEKHWLPVIWITIGIIAFYPVINISLSFYKHLVAYRDDFLGFKLYTVIPQLMSLFMYSCFSYAFYLCKKKN